MISSPGARHWTSAGSLRARTNFVISLEVPFDPFQQPRAAAEICWRGGMVRGGGESGEEQCVRWRWRQAQVLGRSRSRQQQASPRRERGKLQRGSNGESKESREMREGRRSV